MDKFTEKEYLTEIVKLHSFQTQEERDKRLKERLKGKEIVSIIPSKYEHLVHERVLTEVIIVHRDPVMSDDLLKQCLDGKHDLEDIHESSSDPYGRSIVRWCKICGSVVIDMEVDVRTYPGRIMKMKSPEISKLRKKTHDARNTC